MTRREFEADITSIGAVLDAASNLGYYDEMELYDIFGGEYIDDHIYDDLREVISDWNWDTIRDYLNDIRTGYDYYKSDGYLDYIPLGDREAGDMISELRSIMERNGDFEDDDEDEYIEDDSVENEEDPSLVEELIMAAAAF